MMDTIDNRVIQKLTESSNKPLISIYMSTHPAGMEGKQDPIRLKNLLNKARDILKAEPYSISDPDVILSPAYDLLSTSRFWKNQGKGLALFISPEDYFYYRLPRSFDEQVYVGEEYLILPLMPLVHQQGVYHVLSLSKDSVRLFQANLNSIRQVELENVPASFAEHQQFTEVGKDLDFKSSRISGSPMRPIQGGEIDEETRELKNFIKHVENGVTDYLRNLDKPTPLVLAGVRKLTSMYQQSDNYHYTIGDTMDGNFDHVNEAQFHKQSWEVVEPYFMENLHKQKERFNDLSNTNRVSKDMQEIFKSSLIGKVETLFLPAGRDLEAYGIAGNHNDSHDFEIQYADPDDSKAKNLHNYAAIQVLNNGGTVYGLEPDYLPDNAPIAAIYRYE